jgi:hypothetical protein
MDIGGFLSQGTVLQPPTVKGTVTARLMSSLTTIAITEIKGPDSLEAMRIHLRFLIVGLGVVRAGGWEETDDVVEVSLVRCQPLISSLARLINWNTHVNGTFQNAYFRGNLVLGCLVDGFQLGCATCEGIHELEEGLYELA